MSSFDVRKHIRERRLKEATEQLRGKQQFSAPPSVFRQSQQQSARSSVIGFDDAASVHVQSETDADWYQDDIPTQEERQRHPQKMLNKLLVNHCVWSGTNVFGAVKMLKNYRFFAKLGVDTAKNKPLKVC